MLRGLLLIQPPSSEAEGAKNSIGFGDHSGVRPFRDSAKDHALHGSINHHPNAEQELEQSGRVCGLDGMRLLARVFLRVCAQISSLGPRATS